MAPSETPDLIPLQPIAGLDSLSATVAVTVDGLINGERAQGNLHGLLTMNGPRSKVTVSGSLLGTIAAQVGGALVSLFTPTTVDLYQMPDGTYVVVNGLMPLCVKPNAPKALAVLEDLNPARLLTMLTTSEVMRGTLVKEGTLNGRAVQQYRIDGPTFLATARQSHDPQLRAFAAGLWSADDADLFVDAAGGYPLAFQGVYTGAFDPLKLQGRFEIQIALTAVNNNLPVALPPQCDQPITF
jgi:hypothetical protein